MYVFFGDDLEQHKLIFEKALKATHELPTWPNDMHWTSNTIKLKLTHPKKSHGNPCVGFPSRENFFGGKSERVTVTTEGFARMSGQCGSNKYV